MAGPDVISTIANYQDTATAKAAKPLLEKVLQRLAAAPASASTTTPPSQSTTKH